MQIALLAAALAAFSPASDQLTTFAGVQYGAKSLTVMYAVQKIGDVSVSYKADLAKPNLARIESAGTLIVADGTSITLYSKADRTYDKRPQTAETLKSLFSTDRMML